MSRVRQTKNVVRSHYFTNLLANSMKTVPAKAFHDTCNCILIKGPAPALAPNSLYTDLIAAKANFDGYSDTTLNTGPGVVKGDVVVDGADNTALLTTLTWIATGSVTPNNIVGYFVALAAGVNWLWGELFSGPDAVAMAQNGDWVTIETLATFAGFLTTEA